MKTLTLQDQIRDLHQPSLHRVEVPGIITDAPACTECGKAHPCPTYLLAQGDQE
jgi:hypothetical protein